MYKDRYTRNRLLKSKKEIVLTMRKFPCLVSILFLAAIGFAQSQSRASIPPYKTPGLPVEQRVQDLLGRMTLQEKVAMLSGANWMQTVPNERLGIPSIKMADGPLGIRMWGGPSSQINPQMQDNKTAFPAGVARAATWDTELVPTQAQDTAHELNAHR